MKQLTDEHLSTAEIAKLAHEVEERDFQLWSIFVLCLLVLVAGIAALLYPTLSEQLRNRVDGGMIPQLVFGLVTLIILFNIYVLQQRRTLRKTREDLLRELVERQSAEKLSLIDPLTDAFNRRYMDEVISKDLSRLDRLGVKATFLMIDLDNFKAVNTEHGHLVGDQVLAEVAHLMKRAFRASDTIIRFGGDEFLVMLENSDLKNAELAVRRFHNMVKDWNEAAPIAGYTMALSCGMAEYSKGCQMDDVLNRADQDMYSRKGKSDAQFETANG